MSPGIQVFWERVGVCAGLFFFCERDVCERDAREACAACRRGFVGGWLLGCRESAKSVFQKSELASLKQRTFEKQRRFPPAKNQHLSCRVRRQAAHASRASLSCASLFPQKKPNQPHHSQFSFLPETHSPSTQASNFPVKTLLKKWITGPKPKAVTSVPIPTTPPVR